MKLKQGFITYTTGQEQILVSAGTDAFHGMVRSNKTAGFIIDSLKQERTRAELIQLMEDKYNASTQVLSADVDRVLSVLREIGALDE